MWSNGKNCMRTLWKKFSRMRKKWLQETPSGIFSARIFHVCIIKSVSPKISRIGRQKRNNKFFLFDQKNPFGYLFSEMTSKGSISFSFLRNLQNLENLATGPSATAMRLEIWHMFNMLVWTYQTLSYMSFTQFVGHLLILTWN